MTAHSDAWPKGSALDAVTWKARGLVRAREPVVATGWRRLDAELPGGGWPLGTLTELLLPRHGVGELSLLMPALRQLALSDPDQPRWLTWVAPPHELHAPALVQAGLPLSRLLLVRVPGSRERLWAAEQALSSKSCGAVLVWLAGADDRALRRLKLAAAEGQGVALASPAIAADEIAHGRLVAPFHFSLRTPFGYYFVCRPEDAEAPRIKALRDFLIDEAEASTPAEPSVVLAE